MRFNKKITFIHEEDSYNTETGKHETVETEVATIWANVTDNSTQRSFETFGKYDSNTKTIRLAKPIRLNWSFLMIGKDKTKYVKKQYLDTSKVKSLLVGEA
ncbi:phage head completion protein [Lactobacillus terrae]|uniref:phage head completion protein n=1 Tax=Lactobacillus terrae TaxID=2269374 RepID=UPI000C1B70D5|nr:head-tail adaptor protein [Lactobacillus terrae]